MNTYRFSFNGRTRFVDAENIFAAMVEFHALHEGTDISSLTIDTVSTAK